jgi:hypothetical protein
MQAFRNVGGAAEAFGMAPMGMGEKMMTASIPKPQEFAGGVYGYSSIPLYEQAQAKTAATPEGQANLAIRKELYSPEVKSANLARFKELATAKTEAQPVATNNADNRDDLGGDGGDM